MHFPQIDSTQKQLLSNLESNKGEQKLISTTKQLSGFGRNDNQWEHYKNALAFSFTLAPATPTTLTPIEIGIHLCQFIKSGWNREIALKWPNDLLTIDGKKCGGIICNYINPDIIAVGVGLNWSSNSEYGAIFDNWSLTSSEYQELPETILNYIQSSRMQSAEIIDEWTNLCSHLNQKVTIDEKCGIFTRLGSNGEAILDESIKVVAGSLTLDCH